MVFMFLGRKQSKHSTPKSFALQHQMPLILFSWTLKPAFNVWQSMPGVNKTTIVKVGEKQHDNWSQARPKSQDIQYDMLLPLEQFLLWMCAAVPITAQSMPQGHGVQVSFTTTT